MKQFALFVFNGDPLCFIHVLLNALDMISNFWRDHKSAKVNGIRTKTLLEKCDVAIVRFGDKYKQWNAAFNTGYCSAIRRLSLAARFSFQSQCFKLWSNNE